MNNTFVISFTILDMLLALLVIAAIVAVVYLIIVLSGLSKTMKGVQKLVEDNQENLSATLKTLPGISSNLETTLDHVNTLVSQTEPDVVHIVSDVRKVTDKANKISGDVADTVEYFALSAVDTVDSLTSGVNKTTSAIATVQEIVQLVRAYLKK